MFLWITPMPPSCAIAIASRASVTVSIAADISGALMRRPVVRRVSSFTSPGSTAEYAGTRETSSNVRASPISCMLDDLLCRGFAKCTDAR